MANCAMTMLISLVEYADSPATVPVMVVRLELKLGEVSLMLVVLTKPEVFLLILF